VVYIGVYTRVIASQVVYIQGGVYPGMPPYCTLVGIPPPYASLLYHPGYTILPPMVYHVLHSVYSVSDSNVLGSRRELTLGGRLSGAS